MLAHFIDSKTTQCGYFKERNSLFEEYLLEGVSEVEFEYLLANGMRHFGDYFFRPRCQNCYECIPIRIRTADFSMNRSQRRALSSCRDIVMKIGAPNYSDEKFELYLAHKQKFHPLQDDVEDEQNFRLSFYVNTPFGVEFEYYLDDKLVGIGLADCTKNTFSAIYTFYVLPNPKMSLGTYSILKQIEFAQQKNIHYFYLGYYITANQSLNYKANFRPNEVYIEHEWRPYRNTSGDFLLSEENLQWKNFDFLVKAANQPQYF